MQVLREKERIEITFTLSERTVANLDYISKCFNKVRGDLLQEIVDDFLKLYLYDTN